MTRAKPKARMNGIEMKDSGVGWLGEIPAHWDVKPLKTVIKQVMNGAWGAEVNDLQDSLLPCIVLRGTDFPDAASGSLTNAPVRYIDKRDAARKTLQQGDIVIEISGGSETQATGRALLITDKLMSNANSPLLCTNFAKALRLSTDTVTPWFFSIYWFSLYALGRPFIYEKRTTGIRNFQYKDFVANESILLPPLHEQRAIASYLDRETARIDRLIDKTEALNGLLSEKRVALISQAVTKGLDAGAEMKESGVEWLGEIPAHWGVKRLKFLGSLQSGTGITSEQIGDSGDYPVFGGNGIRGYTDDYTHDGDFVLIGRQGALCGNVNYASARFWASEHALVLTQHSEEHVRWLGETLRAMDLNQYAMSAAQPGLSAERIQNLEMPVPPVQETYAIAAYLDREIAKIDALIKKNDELIALLREKRTALISAAVTGKIAVDLTPAPAPPGG